VVCIWGSQNDKTVERVREKPENVCENCERRQAQELSFTLGLERKRQKEHLKEADRVVARRHVCEDYLRRKSRV